MRVIDAVPTSDMVNSLPPEELAAIMLQVMNAEIDRALQRGRAHQPEQFHIGNFCNGQSAAYEQAGQPACGVALAAAWMHLAATGMIAINPQQRNDWYVVTPRGRSIKDKSDYEHFKKASLYPRGALHPAIEKVTYELFVRGAYETAVLMAFRELEIVVRKALNAGYEVLGKDLMVKAFHPRDGVIRDEEELPAEQEALMYLFMGAIGRFKNPPSHREVEFNDPFEALEAIQFASLLMRIAWDRLAREFGFTNLDADAPS